MNLPMTKKEEKELLQDFIANYYSEYNEIMVRLNILNLNLDFITVDTAKNILNEILEREEELNI